MPSYGLDVVALALAVVLAAALALLIARILPPLADLIMRPPVMGSAHVFSSTRARLRSVILAPGQRLTAARYVSSATR